jgi:hypothetical protein
VAKRRVKPKDRIRRTKVFKHRGLEAVEYEFNSCRDYSLALVRPKEWQVERNAYLEGALLHARVLHEFLTYDETVPRYIDDMLRIDFADGWLASPEDGSGDQKVRAATRHLQRNVDLANKHLAHLTWERASAARGATAAKGIDWLFVPMVIDVATILRAWLIHAYPDSEEDVGTLPGVANPAGVAKRLDEQCNEAQIVFRQILAEHTAAQQEPRRPPNYLSGAVIATTTQSTMSPRL